jgi:hypothetical protein
LSEAADSDAKHILLATDSPTLDWDLMLVAAELSQRPSAVETLAYSASNGRPIEDDFRQIRESDLIVFQNKEELKPAFANQRAAQYEEYTEQHFGKPIKAADDIRTYCTNSLNLAEPVRSENLGRNNSQ